MGSTFYDLVSGFTRVKVAFLFEPFRADLAIFIDFRLLICLVHMHFFFHYERKSK